MYRALLLLALLGACTKKAKDGSSCDDVGTTFLSVGHAQLAASDADGKTRASVESQLPAMRDSIVLACKDDKWAVASRDCFAHAGDDAAMLSCYETLTPEQQSLLEKGFSPPKP